MKTGRLSAGAIGAATVSVLILAAARPPVRQAAIKSDQVQTRATPSRRTHNHATTVARVRVSNGHNGGSTRSPK